MAGLKAWDAEKQNYELKSIGPESVAYMRSRINAAPKRRIGFAQIATRKARKRFSIRPAPKLNLSVTYLDFAMCQSSRMVCARGKSSQCCRSASRSRHADWTNAPSKAAPMDWRRWRRARSGGVIPSCSTVWNAPTNASARERCVRFAAITRADTSFAFAFWRPPTTSTLSNLAPEAIEPQNPPESRKSFSTAK